MKDLYLYHHGIRGQRWGIRRFQNEDGSLTKSGKKRYDVDIETAKNKYDIANRKSKEARKEYYKKEHPKTKLSDAEILNEYYNY